VDVAQDWYRRRTFDHRSFTAEALARGRDRSVSVCLPARDEAATIGAILDRLLPLRDARVIDQIVVVDDSSDGTAEIAAGLGAEVHRQCDLLPEFGPVVGKGDAMWRALSVLTGEIVCFLDADSEDFGEHFALGLLGPLLTDDSIRFVKGFYRRPLRVGDTQLPEGGGRVTELMARPLLARFFPELRHVLQPLAGEIAADRALLERVPFATGYAVETAMLVDAWREAGLDALAQVDLDVRQNRHQPLSELGPMAEAVLAAVVSRLDVPELAQAGTPLLERPPMASLEPALD
jgi:glucosyl-3-phosphoglycerate synthase